MNTALTLTVIAATVLAAGLIGAYGTRLSRTTSDFYVASRTVTPAWNASAIGGEYLSAASFLGVAGLVMAYGVDMLWFPVGYTVGYLLLLLFVAAPLRRSGAYTLPDFAEARLGSMAVRRTCSIAVVVIGWLYLIPQLQGAGLTLNTLLGVPSWVGGTVVVVVVAVAVLAGGMRSITLVQAFQYWLKLLAIAVPALILLAVVRSAGGVDLTGELPPVFQERTTVEVTTSVEVEVAQPVSVIVDGEVDGQERTRRDGPLRLLEGEHAIEAPTTLTFAAGAQVPHVLRIPISTGEQWASPLEGGLDHPGYRTLSLMVALFLGTMGLPHVLVRFYTNPDGQAARWTTVAVIALVGTFYLFPPILGALGRYYTPELMLTGQTDAVVLLVPGRVVDGFGGELLGAIVAAGAFAAFLSTSSGLVVSVAGVIAQDVVRARSTSGVRAFRLAALVALAVPWGLTLLAQRISVASAVGMAFAVAASSLAPLLLLGIWWPRLTDIGAMAGVTTGAILATTASLLLVLGGERADWAGALLAQPAAWTMPIGAVVMVVGSLLTQRRLSPTVGRTMIRLHTPEDLQLGRAGGP